MDQIFKNIEYFQPYEFACPCCGVNNLDMNFVKRLDNARDVACVPMILTSACRCPKHNGSVGGSDTSSHLTTSAIKCCAVDIACHNSTHRAKILKGLIKAGFNRIGIGKNFIHADIDLSKPADVFWLYS